jgi:hypothetical protein
VLKSLCNKSRGTGSAALGVGGLAGAGSAVLAANAFQRAAAPASSGASN